MIISLIRNSKSDWYVAFFEENKSDVKKTWEGIRNIVNISKKNRIIPMQLNHKGKVFTDKNGMAESFNDFFVNIGNMVEMKIPVRRTNNIDYLMDRNLNNLYLKPVDESEVHNMISQLKASKSCGPNSIPTKILQNNSHILTKPVTTIINMSF